MAAATSITRRSLIKAFPFFGAAVAVPAAAAEMESSGDRIQRLVSELHEAVSAQYGDQFGAVIDVDGQLWLRNADDIRADREVIDAARSLRRAQKAENEAYAAYRAGPNVLVRGNPLHREYHERNVAKNDALTDLLQIVWRSL
jgi:hypothetical protein